MPRFQLRATTPAIETDLLIALLPELLRGLRSWRFVDAAPQDPHGVRCERLRLVAGAHAQVGARYRLDVPPDDGRLPAATPDDSLAEVVQARRAAGFAGVEQVVLRQLAELRTAPPRAAEPLAAGAVVPAPSGPVRTEIELLQDDSSAVRTALHVEDLTPVELELTRPDRPAALHAQGRVETGETGYVGRATEELEKELARSSGWSEDSLRAAFGAAPSPAEVAGTLLDVALVHLRPRSPV